MTPDRDTRILEAIATLQRLGAKITNEAVAEAAHMGRRQITAFMREWRKARGLSRPPRHGGPWRLPEAPVQEGQGRPEPSPEKDDAMDLHVMMASATPQDAPDAVPQVQALHDAWKRLDQRKWTAQGRPRADVWAASDLAGKDYMRACCYATSLAARLRADRLHQRQPKPDLMARLIDLVGIGDAERSIAMIGNKP